MKIDIYKILGKEKTTGVIPQENDLIILVGVLDNQITKNGEGFQVYENFNDAKKYFPELDAEKWSANFTKSFGFNELRYYQYSPFGLKRTKAIRFETRNAYNLYSA